MQKPIVRHMIVGQPVIIGARPKPPPPPVEEEPEEKDTEPEEEELEEESKSGIPQEILDKVYAEIEEIEQKLKLTEENLSQAQVEKTQAEELKKQSEELKADAEKIKRQAEEFKRQAEKQAQEILDKAQTEAEKIVEDTKQEAKELLDKVQKEGYDEGYKDGKKQGIKDGKEKIEDELADIVKQTNKKAQKTLQDAKEQTADYFIKAEDDIVKVVVMAIEKILPQHFLDAPQVILPVVREAINHVRDQKEIIIHVEPFSYDLILMARSEFRSMLSDGTATIEVVSDEALQPGDCVIETPNGAVDARLSTQLSLIKKAVLNVLHNRE